MSDLNVFFVHGFANSGKTTLCNTINKIQLDDVDTNDIIIKDLDELLGYIENGQQLLDKEKINEFMNQNSNKKNIIFCGVYFLNIDEIYNHDNVKNRNKYVYLLKTEKFSVFNCIFRYQPNTYKLWLLGNIYDYVSKQNSFCNEVSNIIKTDTSLHRHIHGQNFINFDINSLTGADFKYIIVEISKIICGENDSHFEKNIRDQIDKIVLMEVVKNKLKLISLICLRILLFLTGYIHFIYENKRNITTFIILLPFPLKISVIVWLILLVKYNFYIISVRKCIQLTYSILSTDRYKKTRKAKIFFKKLDKSFYENKVILLDQKQIKNYKEKNSNKIVEDLQVKLSTYLSSIDRNNDKEFDDYITKLFKF